MGRYFVGYSDYDGSTGSSFDNRVCTIVTTKNYADYIIKKGYNNSTNKDICIYIVLMSKKYSLEYYLKEINVPYQPTINQRIIIDTTVQDFRKNKHSVIYIWGKTGVGKSMTGMLLAKQLNGILVTGFDPLTTRYDYINMLNDLKRWNFNNNIKIDEIPIIVQLDEIDKVVENIIKPSDNKDSSEVNGIFLSKGEWNGFFDLIDRGIYQNLIVIMTSNKKITDLTDDGSLFRKGRIDRIF